MGPGATLRHVKKTSTRAFKTAWFSKAARKSRIGDPALVAAIREVMQGQADDLGGGVFKKRLNKNMHRSIILAKGGRHWIFAYLFAKKDRASIDGAELADFRKLAHAFGRMTDTELQAVLKQGDLLELCDEK
ncbi:MAG: type II toxin-antitoxin system RelE/ParE family toxin [Betaproteobacteria bacterium]|nr:type II toxin-antitoxin system RelE/ParE family toxin [Betaproteobacteria bacterium]